MIRTIRDIQIRINSLGLLQEQGKPMLVVDGMNGKKTQKAISLAKSYMGVQYVEDLFDPSGITRVHWHWTGGNHKVSDHDRRFYNDLFDKNGYHYDGIAPAHQQAFYLPGRVGVSHTLNANTGAIGMAVAGMFNARTFGSKVEPGNYPITWESIDTMLERTAEYCRYYDIRISPWTTLTHAEVQPSIGIRQRNKWDIQVLPDKLGLLKEPMTVGNILRDRMIENYF